MIFQFFFEFCTSSSISIVDRGSSFHSRFCPIGRLFVRTPRGGSIRPWWVRTQYHTGVGTCTIYCMRIIIIVQVVSSCTGTCSNRKSQGKRGNQATKRQAACLPACCLPTTTLVATSASRSRLLVRSNSLATRKYQIDIIHLPLNLY